VIKTSTPRPPSYAGKVVTRDELLKRIGPRPRAKKVVMCHGVFDIVHPGHLRHLAFAKEKADILVASITADEHITKADMRPYVPQELRALNLAALETVDYVIVDANPTPIENIKTIQPDYFAKGYEYFSTKLPARTQEERDAVEAYGGEMLFTPGDVTYSSSALITAQPPRLHIEKLMALMEAEGISFDDLRDAERSFASYRVHVVGDTIVDAYSYCTLLGAAPKSPTFSVRHQSTERFTGGAAIVAKHMRAGGADVTYTTVLGDDPLKQFVLEDLESAGVRAHVFFDHTRPTTYKQRFIADGQKMLQVDQVDNRAIPEKAIEVAREAIGSERADVVVFSDFRHGMFTRESVPLLASAIPAGVLRVADSQVSNRWGNILDFEGFDLLTPNEREARFSLGDQDSTVRPLASELFRRAGCRFLILKLGERGLIGYRSAGPMPREFFTVDSFVEHLVDPIGAGDALLAHAALGLVATKNIVVAAILGAIGAALACERQGNVPVRPAEVQTRIDLLQRRASYSNE
jgi:rfaE bifunctional protein kinase chain/domain/rfaE bifunctional protein nucleotidyltransferase chain/domain